MKTPRIDGAGRGANDKVRGTESGTWALPFHILRFERCSYGSKQAELTISIDGLGDFDCDFFIPTNGKPSFATAKSIRSKFTGAYERTVRLDDDFASALLEAIETRLAGDNAEVAD